METILITGAGPNGVTGRRIRDYLSTYTQYNILDPSSKELDLTDSNQVQGFFKENNIDYVVHSAVVAPSRNHDNSDPHKEIESNLRMFFNLAHQSNEFKKMFYIGSGAEFDKRKPIKIVNESDFPSSIPQDKYGFIKYILNHISTNSANIYNLRVFGTINPYEPSERNVISLMCSQIAKGQTIRLHQNRRFSFIDVDDIARFIIYGFTHELKYHDYNMIGYTGEIKDIANKVRNLLFPKMDIEFKELEKGYEYTGDSTRLNKEYFYTTPIIESLQKVLDNLNQN